MYDITQEKTFDNIRNWLRNIEEVIRTENNLTSKEWVLPHYDRHCSSEFKVAQNSFQQLGFDGSL